jgi:hypothetical protein
VINGRRRWVGHVAWVWEGEVPTGIRWGSLSKGDHLEYLGTDARIIFKWIIKRWDGGHG